MALKPTNIWPAFYFPKHYCGAWLGSDLCWCWDKHELFFQSHEPVMLCVGHVETSVECFKGTSQWCVLFMLRQVWCFRDMSQWCCVLIMLRQVWVVSRAWASDVVCWSCWDKCVVSGKWTSDVMCWSCWDKCGLFQVHEPVMLCVDHVETSVLFQGKSQWCYVLIMLRQVWVVSRTWTSDVMCWSCWGKCVVSGKSQWCCVLNMLRQVCVVSGAQVSDVECWSCWDRCVVSGAWASDVVLITLRQVWVVSLFNGTSQWCWGPTSAGVPLLSMLCPALTEASLCWSGWDKCVLFQGHEPVMLRTQYRCHPIISAVSNSLFYQNQLVDGVTAQDRPPVLVSFTVYISSFNRGLNLVKMSVQHCFLNIFYIHVLACTQTFVELYRSGPLMDNIYFTVKHVFT